MTAGVYLITHRPSGLRYVGAGLCPERRIQSHLNPRAVECWKWRLPAGDSTPSRELHGQIIERVAGGELCQAERDWWFLLKPELNDPKIPTMRGFSGERLTKTCTCEDMRRFIKECAAKGLLSSRDRHRSKADLWSSVVELMEKEAQARRGHLLEAIQ